jgi:biofilm PGA synthesis lipoprotein PgaB
MQGFRHDLIKSVVLLGMVSAAAVADDSAVIFMYHHVDDSTPASTSIPPALFARQLDYLEREGFSVLPLLELVEAIASGREVPERSIAITFDDGYSSVMDQALPELEKRGWPFTVFVNTQAVDQGFGGYLSWDDLRALGQSGGTIGNHSASHAHLLRRESGESDSRWRSRINDDIEMAAQRLEEEVGRYSIAVFAYPYGEYTTELKEIVSAHGLYAVGQQSGPFGPHSDFLALPRFPIAASLQSIDEFGLRARTRPLPVRLIGEERHVLESTEAQPALLLALENNDDVRVDALNCYASGQGRMMIEWRNEQRDEFAVIPAEPFSSGRSKVNCTAPSASAAGIYYWYGHLWMKKQSNGDWYRE